MPNTLRSQTIIATTTTMLKIDLIAPSIGMNELTTQRRKPAMISIRRIVNNGIILIYLCISKVIQFMTIIVI
jgi:hypothetical protein